MKKLGVSQTIGIFANLGVLVGVLLLVYELALNRNMMRAQIRNSIAETLINMRHSEALSTDLLEMEARIAGGLALTPVDAARFEALWTAYFRYWENVHYQFRNGLYEDTEYLHNARRGAESCATSTA